jgi:membrane-associated phospholipid phosphatase
VPAVLRWGVDVVLWWQRFSPTLDGPFRVITQLGDGAFFFVLFLALYWAVDRDAALRLAALYLFSGLVNAGLKSLLGQPRPFELDERVLALVPAAGRGFPSGHTQSTVVVWGYLAHRWRHRWLTALAVAAMILVPLSRVYLGVHFPTDLLGGYAIGALILMSGIAHGERTARAWRRLSPVIRQGGALVFIFLVVIWRSGGHGLVATAGSAAGAGIVAMFLERRLVRFRPPASLRFRLRAVLLGLTTLVAVMGIASTTAIVCRCGAVGAHLGVAATAAWALLGVPWLLVRVGLAPAEGHA